MITPATLLQRTFPKRKPNSLEQSREKQLFQRASVMIENQSPQPVKGGRDSREQGSRSTQQDANHEPLIKAGFLVLVLT